MMRDVASKINHDQLSKKKTFESTAKTQRQQNEEFTKIVLVADSIHISIKSTSKALIIILF